MYREGTPIGRTSLNRTLNHKCALSIIYTKSAKTSSISVRFCINTCPVSLFLLPSYKAKCVAMHNSRMREMPLCTRRTKVDNIQIHTNTLKSWQEQFIMLDLYLHTSSEGSSLLCAGHQIVECLLKFLLSLSGYDYVLVSVCVCVCVSVCVSKSPHMSPSEKMRKPSLYIT